MLAYLKDVNLAPLLVNLNGFHVFFPYHLYSDLFPSADVLPKPYLSKLPLS